MENANVEHIQQWTRRRFLGTAAGVALAAGVVPRCIAQPANGLTGRVVRARDPRATVDFEPQPAVVRAMLEDAIASLTGKPTAVEALQSLFPPIAPDHRIVIKVNSMAGPPSIGTTAASILAMVQLVRSLATTAGAPVSADQVTVWDNAPLRYLREPLDGLCTVKETYTPEQWEIDPGSRVHLAHPSDESGFPVQRVLSEADHLISMGQLKAHPLTGSCGVMKNFYGAVEVALDLHSHGPWARSQKSGPWTIDGECSLGFADDKGLSTSLKLAPGTYTSKQVVEAAQAQCQGLQAMDIGIGGGQVLFASGNDQATELRLEGSLLAPLSLPAGRCLPTRVDQIVPELWADPLIGPKVRLCVIDGLLAIYDQGPYHEPHEFLTFPERTPNLLLASTDPVAIDALAAQMVEAERTLHDDLKDAFDTTYLATSESMGLGLATGYSVVERSAAN